MPIYSQFIISYSGTRYFPNWQETLIQGQSCYANWHFPFLQCILQPLPFYKQHRLLLQKLTGHGMPASNGWNSDPSPPRWRTYPAIFTTLEYYFLQFYSFTIYNLKLLAQSCYLNYYVCAKPSTMLLHITHYNLFQNIWLNMAEPMRVWEEFYDPENLYVASLPVHKRILVPNNSYIHSITSTNYHFPAYSPTKINQITASSKIRENSSSDWDDVSTTYDRIIGRYRTDPPPNKEFLPLLIEKISTKATVIYTYYMIPRIKPYFAATLLTSCALPRQDCPT